MKYYDVYSKQSNGDLKLIAPIWAHNAKDALQEFKDAWGDNYGKVLVLEQFSTSRDWYGIIV